MIHQTSKARFHIPMSGHPALHREIRLITDGEKNIVPVRRLPRRSPSPGEAKTETDARLELIARMMPTMIATVKEFRGMGADTETIMRLFRIFTDEFDDDIEAERDEDELLDE